MKRTLWLFIILLLPYAGGLLLLSEPVARSVGVTGAPRLARTSGSAEATTTATLNLAAPLGLVILDVSSSMNGNDEEFRQTMAAEIFAYVFARVIADDVGPGNKDLINFASVVYPALQPDHKRRANDLQQTGMDAAYILWPPNPNSTPWLKIDTANAAPVMAQIQESFARVMGTKGADRRDGGRTPHGAGAMAAVRLVEHYCAAHGSNASVFAVFMTDEDTPTFHSSADALKRACPHLTLSEVILKIRTSADTMVEQFLRALDLHPQDVHSGTTSADGWEIPGSLKSRSMPLIITASQPPRVETDTGVQIEVLGHDGIYYSVFDPRDPKFPGAKRLKISGSGLREVKVFTRPSWKFSLQPGVYDVLENVDRPTLVLEYQSTEPPGDQGSKDVMILGPDGKECGRASLSYDARANRFASMLPELNLPGNQPRVDCVALLRMVDGSEVRFTFPALRGLSMRWWDAQQRKGVTTVEIPVNPGATP